MRSPWFVLVVIAAVLALTAGCGPSTEELEAVEYTPQSVEGWEVSTPAEQGLDPMLVAELYYNAAELETLYGLLVIKNGRLVAEAYLNEGTIDQKTLLASVSKSFVSALVGIALDERHLTSLDQKMIEFFPEYADQIKDPRKEEITIRQLLQMRSGYPWEESDPALMDAMWEGDNPPLVVDFPLTADPGAKHQYSNLTSHWLGMIVERSTGIDLKTYAEEHLLEQIDSEMGEFWEDDWGGYFPLFHLTARDAAKFGLMYLNDGEYDGNQVVSGEWARDSLRSYSENAWITNKLGRYYGDIGYGYQWWSAVVGEQDVNMAWAMAGSRSS